MKKTFSIFWFSMILAIVCYSSLDAQVPRSASAARYENGDDILTINNTSMKISNLFTLDSLKSPHMASFEIEVNSATESKNILSSLFSAMQGNQALKVTLSKQNFQNQITESRDYNAATVSEILLPDLNGSSKEIARVKVKILAPDVSDKSDSKDIAIKLQGQIRGAMSSNFNVVMGELPTKRVTSISNLRTANGYINFKLEVNRIDSKPWKEWFNTGNGKRQEAKISLMDPSLANEIISFQLSEVEIVSDSESSSSNQDGIPKTVIGLRARKVDLFK